MKNDAPGGFDRHAITESKLAGRLAAIGSQTGFDTEAQLSIQRLQVDQLVRALPLLILFLACAAFLIHSLTSFTNVFELAALWFGAVAFTCIGLMAVFAFWLSQRFIQRPDLYLRGMEVLCLALGLVWAVPSAVALQMAAAENIYPIAGIILATLGVAVAALGRVPTGAVVFVSLVTAALARALYLASDQTHVVVALAAAIYGLVLVAIVINTHVDFLQRARAELELRQQNEGLVVLLKDFEREAKDCLWQTDETGRLIYFSPRFADAFGIAPDDLHLRPLRHLLADHAKTEKWRAMDLAMVDGAAVDTSAIEFLIRGKAIVMQFSAQALRDSRGHLSGYRGVARDVSVSHEAERRVELALQATENTGAVKSQFLSIMSHELRTPINAILGFAELLVQERSESIPQKTRVEFAQTILANGQQLQHLVNDIIDATRIERGALQLVEQNVDAAELVEVAIKHCREQAECRQISIVGRLTDGVSITGDSNRLKQVMVNLLKNAIKFSPASGIINVEMQKGYEGQFVLAVRDAGIGISNLDVERLFEPFVQADEGLARHFGGAGLGLPIARRIARLHGGDVTLQKLEGAGTSATLILPKSRIEWPNLQSAAEKIVA